MKKKFINGFLMVALLFAASTSFVSCKDNVDDDLADLYAQLAAQKAALEQEINNIQQNIYNIEEVTKVVTADLSGVNGRIDSLNGVVDDLKGQVDVINNWIITQSLTTDSIAAELSNTNAAVDSLAAVVARLENLIGNNIITGVRVDATHNPVFGSINLGQNLQVLSALYGENTTGIFEFPYEGSDFNVGGVHWFCYLEPNEIGVTPYDMTQTDYITDVVGNAGKAYFTINSSDFNGLDLSKYSFEIQNSRGKAAPITLSNVKRSDVLLKPGIYWKGFPYTTAGEVNDGGDSNGLYEADATIAEKDLESITFGADNEKLFYDLRTVQGTVRDAIDAVKAAEGRNAKIEQAVLSSLSVVSNVYNTLTSAFKDASNGTNAAYQLQALSVYENGDGVKVRKAVSNYSLLTSAIQPLSYNTFWWYEDTKTANWTIEQLEKALDWLARKIEARYGNSVVTAKIVSLDDATQTITVAVGSETADWTPVVPSHYTAISQEVNAKGLDNVNSELARLLSPVSLGKVATKTADRAQAYLEKFSNFIIQRASEHWLTRALAPIILFEGSNGVDRLCEGMILNRGTMHAYLTSATFESLAPAFKKYVAVKDLKTNELVQSALLPGSTQTFDYDLTVPGEYYVIISCVDYYGYVITKKFHVYVK